MHTFRNAGFERVLGWKSSLLWEEATDSPGTPWANTSATKLTKTISGC